jgi:hypothetical protein
MRRKWRAPATVWSVTHNRYEQRKLEENDRTIKGAKGLPLQESATGLGLGQVEKTRVKEEHSSSPPPLIADTSETLEDRETDEQQEAASSLRSKYHYDHSYASLTS